MICTTDLEGACVHLTGAKLDERKSKPSGKESLDIILQKMNHQLLAKIGRHTGQHSSSWQQEVLADICDTIVRDTCQEYEEQSQTVKEDELKKENNSKKPLAVSLKTVIHDKVKHGVAIDCKESNWECNDVMEIIISNEVARRNIANTKKDQIYD